MTETYEPFLLVALMALLGGWFASMTLRLLWNSTLPELLQAPRINSWQAAKLILMATILLLPALVLA